jgi:predicted amidohydrolase
MSKRQSTVKVAAVQAAPVAFDLAESLKKVERLTKKAAQEAADLVVFPYVSLLRCQPQV